MHLIKPHKRAIHIRQRVHQPPESTAHTHINCALHPSTHMQTKLETQEHSERERRCIMIIQNLLEGKNNPSLLLVSSSWYKL